MRSSVVLCTFNGEKFLHQQLDSIFTQTLLPDEIIISDDISTDQTVQIINNFKILFGEKLKVFHQTQRLKPVNNFSFAASTTNADIIFFCDQDDIWLPNKIEILKNELSKNPDMDAIFTDALLIDDKDLNLGITMMESIGVKEEGQFYFEMDSLFPYILKTGNIVTGATMAIRKTALQNLLPFKSFYGEYHDEYMAMKLAAQNKILYHPIPLIQYRIHASQQVGTVQENQRSFYLNRRKNIWLNNFNGLDRETAIYAAWRYLIRSRKYCTEPGLEHLRQEAENTFNRIRSAYLSSLSYLRKKKVLMDWRKRKDFDITWAKVFYL